MDMHTFEQQCDAAQSSPLNPRAPCTASRSVGHTGDCDEDLPLPHTQLAVSPLRRLSLQPPVLEHIQPRPSTPLPPSPAAAVQVVRSHAAAQEQLDVDEKKAAIHKHRTDFAALPSRWMAPHSVDSDSDGDGPVGWNERRQSGGERSKAGLGWSTREAACVEGAKAEVEEVKEGETQARQRARWQQRKKQQEQLQQHMTEHASKSRWWS